MGNKTTKLESKGLLAGDTVTTIEYCTRCYRSTGTLCYLTHEDIQCPHDVLLFKGTHVECKVCKSTQETGKGPPSGHCLRKCLTLEAEYFAVANEVVHLHNKCPVLREFRAGQVHKCRPRALEYPVSYCRLCIHKFSRNRNDTTA